MKLMEMFDSPVQGYEDANADHSKPIWKQSRKTKLTLKQIRKLRKMLDVRNYEKQKNLKRIHAQYGPKPDAAAAPGM